VLAPVEKPLTPGATEPNELHWETTDRQTHQERKNRLCHAESDIIGEMPENPYHSPTESSQFEPQTPDAGLQPFTCAVIGFAAGTLLVAPFVLSADQTVCLRGGAIFGGLPSAIVAFALAVRRRRRAQGE
jgi:hypothetical protein